MNGIGRLSLLAMCAAFSATAWADAPTTDSLEFTVKLGNYQYTENPNFMSLESTPAVGGGLIYTRPLDNKHTIRLEGHYTAASADYRSSQGATSKNSNSYTDLRLFMQRHMTLRSGNTLTPRIGIGYRNLRNVLKDITPSILGYPRISQYWYLPVGLEYKNHRGYYVDGELGWLLRGYQDSKLSQAGTGLPDIRNKQDSGYNLRFKAGFEGDWYKIGPYIDFWKVDQSDSVSCGSGTCFEPKNFTREFGITFSTTWDDISGRKRRMTKLKQPDATWDKPVYIHQTYHTPVPSRGSFGQPDTIRYKTTHY